MNRWRLSPGTFRGVTGKLTRIDVRTIVDNQTSPYRKF